MQILNDFTTSVRKALEEIDPNYEKLPGLVICGTHSPHDVIPLIKEISQARVSGLPFLGICFGHQLAAIEYAGSVLRIEDATSEEFSKAGTFVVYKLPELNVGLKPVKDPDLPLFFIQDIPVYYSRESFWNNYEVMPDILARWEKPINFITCQYHPEYQSSKSKPHPLLIKFIDLCKAHQKKNQ